MNEFHISHVLAAWEPWDRPGTRPPGVSDELDRHYKDVELKIALKAYHPPTPMTWVWTEEIASIMLRRPDAKRGWLGDRWKCRLEKDAASGEATVWAETMPKVPLELHRVREEDRLAYAHCTRRFLQDIYDVVSRRLPSKTAARLERVGEPMAAE